jgi:ketosteroid isomerase-like protein
MNDSAENVARAFVRAINGQDMDGLAELMAPGHRFVDSLGNVVQGREAVCAGWVGYFRMVPDYSIAVDEILTDGPVAVMLGIAQGTYAPGGLLKAENHWEIPLAIRALIKNGLIVEWRAYADNEPMRQMMKSAG